jgi:hypothetical protein
MKISNKINNEISSKTIFILPTMHDITFDRVIYMRITVQTLYHKSINHRYIIKERIITIST